MTIERVDQVRAADMTLISMARGFLYLVANIDWGSLEGLGVAAVPHDRRKLLRSHAAASAGGRPPAKDFRVEARNGMS